MKSTKTVQSYKSTAKEKNRSTRKNVDTGFPDAARIKEQNAASFPINGKGSPWDYTCPQYDQRSSNFVNAGTHYGTGINQPIGHTGKAKDEVPVLPCHRVNSLQDDDLG